MTDQPSDTDLHEYQPTVPTAYIALAWLWVGIPFAYITARTLRASFAERATA